MKLKNQLLALGAVGISFLISGCTTPAKPENMAARPLELGITHPHSVGVEAGQRDYEEKGSMAQISDSALRDAIVESLKANSVFESVVEVGNADYILYATITSIKQPMFGMSFTVPMTTEWKLIEAASDKTVWNSTIETAHTARAGEAFAGATRLRLATEGSMRDAIEKALSEISELSL